MIALRFYPFPFIVVIAGVALWFMSMDLAPWIAGSDHADWEIRRRVSLWFGLGTLVIAWAVDWLRRGDFAFWLHLFGMLAFWGAVTSTSGGTTFDKALYCAMNVVLLFLSVLGLPFETIDVDLARRAQRTPEFLQRNAFGQVPVIEDGDVTLADSNAILVYLARRYAPGSRWLPDEPVADARVQRWLSIAAGEMKFGPAAARVITVWRGPGDLAEAHALAARLFHFMEDQLATRAFLAADHPIDHACERRPDQRCEPEQPELLQSPAAGEQRRPGAAGRIHRRVGHRDADEMDQSQAEPDGDRCKAARRVAVG